MKRVLITGMSGTGKSSVIRALADRGLWAVDTDYDCYSHEVEVSREELTGLGPGKDWVWHEDRLRQLLASEDGGVLFVAGCSPNQGKFYDRFDHVILLSAPAKVMAERLVERTDNPYGQRSEEVARSLALKEIIEPVLRQQASLEIDTTVALKDVVSAVLRHAGCSWPELD